MKLEISQRLGYLYFETCCLANEHKITDCSFSWNYIHDLSLKNESIFEYYELSIPHYSILRKST